MGKAGPSPTPTPEPKRAVPPPMTTFTARNRKPSRGRSITFPQNHWTFDKPSITFCRAVRQELSSGGEVFVCGGGSHNRLLLERLSGQLPGLRVDTTASLGIAPDWVEAAAFAWLAQRCLEGAPGNVPTVTGASRATVLGAIYP